MGGGSSTWEGVAKGLECSGRGGGGGGEGSEVDIAREVAGQTDSR